MVLIAFVLLLLVGGGCVSSRYNSLVSSQEAVDQKFSVIDVQFKRRADLIPQLVSTVKGSASYEKGVLTEVTAARASVGKLQMPANASSDPALLEQYLQGQQQLGGAVGRLLVTMEKYPDLKATAGFRDLQAQIEGTENRIAVARIDYVDAVKKYNTGLRQFPTNMIAGFFGFERLPQLQAATPEDREVPKIDFGGQ